MHTVYVKNCSPTQALSGWTPYKLIFGSKPTLAHLPVWGTRVWVHDDTHSKLDMHARDGHWVGFDPKSGAHRIYLPSQHRIAVKRNVTFERPGSVILGPELLQHE